MPRSPEPARGQMLDAALRLFAERGLEAVSLREIRLAAGQGNAGALHYHFGSRDGLLRAVLARALPPLVERRRVLLAEAAAADGLRPVVAVFVRPVAELAAGGEPGRWLLMLLDQLHDDVSLSLDGIMALVGDTAIGDATALLRQRLGPLPAEVAAERMVLANSMFLHAAALRARGGARLPRLDDHAFEETLIDMFLGAVTAPVYASPA